MKLPDAFCENCLAYLVLLSPNVQLLHYFYYVIHVHKIRMSYGETVSVTLSSHILSILDLDEYFYFDKF
jgi:hypothetical protein